MKVKSQRCKGKSSEGILTLKATSPCDRDLFRKLSDLNLGLYEDMGNFVKSISVKNIDGVREFSTLKIKIRQ